VRTLKRESLAVFVDHLSADEFNGWRIEHESMHHQFAAVPCIHSAPSASTTVGSSASNCHHQNSVLTNKQQHSLQISITTSLEQQQN
jgi:hypothetical protein